MGFPPLLVVKASLAAMLTLALTGPSVAQTPTVTSFRPVFTIPFNVDNGENVLATIEDPKAVDAQQVCPGYTATKVKTTDAGLTADLSLAGKACNVYGTDIEHLSLTVEYQAADRLHVQIVPTYIDSKNASQYILSPELVQRPTIDPGDHGKDGLAFSWSNDPSFSFTVTRKATGDVLFCTSGKKLVFENQFVEFASTLPDEYNMYGLGETIHGLRLGTNFTKTIYAVDAGNPIDGNEYGSHPFYLETRYFKVDATTGNSTLVTGAVDAAANYTSQSHGVYLRNAHGQEVLLREKQLTWRTIGGSIDLYFYAGPTPPDVTKSYIKSAAGLPAMQQYFTLGFHQCRWGYRNWTELQTVIDSFEKNGIPLESIWSDIDYMNQYRDFENDQNTFGYEEGGKFLQQLHDSGRHYIPIVDSAIYAPNPDNATDAYAPFTEGNEMDVFVKNPDGSTYIGAVWPGYTVFPDWLAPKAGQWWTNQMYRHHMNITFDGIWIDMSEVSSFCVGSCGTGNLTLNPAHPPFLLPGEPGAVVYDYPEGYSLTNPREAAAAASASAAQASSTSTTADAAAKTDYRRTPVTVGERDVNYPPYVINHLNKDLAVHAVSPNATHADGTQEYDIHNLFGHQILNATYNSLRDIFPTKRPFIIGRSTFVGSGRWAGHWGGDNFSQWRSMFFSIPQALTFSLFGIPMFGADTCGFQGNTDEELCNRWMQMSAFMPFYRNHNVLSATAQEPYVWASVAEATRTAMEIRFRLLPYMYTLLQRAHESGSTVLRALAWEFPNEPGLAAVDRQFLLGGALLITPVLAPGAKTVDGVFPGIAQGEIWYDWYLQKPFVAAAGKNTTIDARLGHIPVFVRGGSILPTQEPAMTTREARKKPWGVICALDRNGAAKGELYVDDGESVTPEASLDVTFDLKSSDQGGYLNVTRVGEYKDTNRLANVTIMGVKQAYVKTVSFNGTEVQKESWQHDGEQGVLTVRNLSNVTGISGGHGAWSANWGLAWS